MAYLSKLTLPIKDPRTGTVTSQTFDIKGGTLADAYTVNDTTSATINNTDAVPMLEDDGTTQTKKKVLWSSIITAIKAVLATVATSGDYNDLTNKPTIPAAQIQSDWTQSDNTVADFIKNKPTLGTAAGKDFTTTVTSGSTDLITSGAVLAAILARMDFKIANNRLYVKDIS